VNTTAVVVIILVLLAVAALGLVLARRRRSAQLQERFGPEYERSVSAASGDRRAAEAALVERQQRRESFDVRELQPEQRARFRESWDEVQRGFVDDPRRSLRSADVLVADVMKARGYPVDDDFDRRADDLSVDHPRVVQHYREARRVRDTDGDADTEQQRRAVTNYRSLIEALLGDDDARGTDRADRTDDGSTARPERDGDRAPGTGRHALRDPDDRDRDDRDADRTVRPPNDPNGNLPPRTEERTR
jgi:hypothetical protein